MSRRKKCINNHYYHQHDREFHRYHRSLRIFRPAVFLFNILILYLLFKWIGNKSIAIFFMIFIGAKEIVHIFFLWRLEKRIFKPIDEMKKGFYEIAKGNYDVQIDYQDKNAIRLLIEPFNHMTKKLQESEKLKLEYENNRKNLITNISHDLKTPITSIQGYIEAILDDDMDVPPEKLNKYLNTIYSNTNYINRLIDDLFLFSKLDIQKLEFKYEKISISSYMNDLMEEFKIELEDKLIKLNYISEIKNNDYVSIDRKRIYQAIRNIIGNAVKHGPKDGLRIDVELFSRDNYICINIKDNGPGIPEDKLPYIFDRFYRIDNERTKDLMSTGLGLAISKELIEAHRGNISATSTIGEGTLFTIALPIEK